jgi:outer membrane protein assembly factor BamB
VRRVQLELPSGQVTAAPVWFHGGLLVPVNDGEVALLSLETGKSISKPFLPRLAPGEQINWLQPAVVSDDEFVIADNRREISRVAYRGEPAPHLQLQESRDVPVELVSPLVHLGDSVFAVARSSGSDALITLTTDSLTITHQHDLRGTRVTWGPTRVGEAVLFLTDDSELHCYTDPEAAAWEHSPAFGLPAGAPLVRNGTLMFSSYSGEVWEVARETGEVLARVNVGERLSSSPVSVGGRILVAGEDGTLHVVSILAES